jgi:hypothetical protein
MSQDQTSNIRKRNILTGVVVVVAILLLVWWYLASSSNPAAPKTNALSPEVLTSNIIRTLSGTVTAVNGSSIILHVVSNIPFGDASLNDRTVLIASSTKIVALVPKDPKTFQSEMAALTKAMQSESSTSTQIIADPASIKQVIVDPANIKVGDVIIVTASENIKTLKEFTAGEIQIQLKVGSIFIRSFYPLSSYKLKYEIILYNSHSLG